MTADINELGKRASELTVALTGRVKINARSLELFLGSFFAGLHIMLEDYPGTGKTTLAKTLATAIDFGETRENDFPHFRRIQFTPDLLPYDIIGTEVFNRDTNEFLFRKGALFTSLLLADELNRGNPKVQSALLEAMGERQVTVFGKTYPLPPLFFVIGTQNPYETEGAFPLPQSSLDRFGVSLSLGYPDVDSERDILARNLIDFSESEIPRVMTSSELMEIREFVKAIHVSPELVGLIAIFGRNSREYRGFSRGFSTRSLLFCQAAAKGLAFVRGRDTVIDDDIRTVALPVFSHRLSGKEERALLPAFIDESMNGWLKP